MSTKGASLFLRGFHLVHRALWALLCGIGITIAGLPSANAEFVNGSFESDYSGWTIRHLRNPAVIPTFPPLTESHLGLTNDTANAWTNTGLGYGFVFTDVVGNGSDAKAPAVTFPLFGNKSARINYNGNQRRASAITQTATIGVGDIDPADGKAHIRFAVAPVLENPGHNPNEQPYFFVEVRNLTKSTQLFQTFNFSNQSGVPWQTVGGYQFTSWQAIDVAPGAGLMDVGDQIQVTIIASGCGPSGHEGHVYVDSSAGFNSLPGPFVTASAPQFTFAGATVNYSYSYNNGGTTAMPNTEITIVSPQDNSATRKNLRVNTGTLPPSCSVATSGAIGSEIDTVTCSVGTLNPGNNGTFQIGFIAPNPTTGPINHGNYGISASNAPFLLGPLVQSGITTTPLSDLAVTLTDGISAATWGQNLTYTMVVANQGPAVAPAGTLVKTVAPSSLTGLAWSCTGAGGAVCPATSGTGPLNETVTAAIPVGGSLTYTIQATATGTGTGTITHSGSATVAAGVIDPQASNNTGADVDNVGPGLQSLTLNKTGAGQGTVTSVLAGINCGLGCTTQTNDFPSNSQIVLYSSAPPGSIFAGWSGGGCSGTATSCTVTMDAVKAVTANFAIPVNVTTVVTTGNGTVVPGNGVVQPTTAGGTVSLTVNPSAGYAPTFSDNCGSGGASTGGSLVGNIYTTNAVSQDCTVSVGFTNTGVVTVTPTVGPNGSITPNQARSVATGGTVSYVVTPNSGFARTTPTGTCPAGTWAGNVYSIGPVNANCNVNFGFAASYTVTGSITSGSGTITPSFVNVLSGGQAQFTIASAIGFVAVIDASSTCAGGTWTGNVYTVNNITSACNVAARFDPRAYSVTASLGSGPGTVSPNVQSVTHGNSATITLNPTAPGVQATLKAGSTCIGNFSAGNTVFTIPNVVGACSAVFDFVATGPSPASIPTLSEYGLILLAILMMGSFWIRQNGSFADVKNRINKITGRGR